MIEIVCIILACLLWWYREKQWRKRLRRAMYERMTADGEKASEYDKVIEAIVEGIDEFNSWHDKKLTFQKIGGKWRLDYGGE